MSIDASKWARTADVQKSSSKLVLLELAHLVRAYAADWTAFASIDYLAKVTHLNRKTVIEALGRLRTLGAIVDTGLRAGASRSCPVYRLCPAAVPTVCAPAVEMPTEEGDDDAGANENADIGTGNDANTNAISPQAAEEALCQQGALALDECAPDTASNAPTAQNAEPCMTADPLASQIPAGLEKTGASLPTTPAPHKIRAPGTRRTQRAKPLPAAGAGATRLPADWALPARWRAWTSRARPHWSAEKIDAMVLTFGAYWRSKPGQAGYSEDWFESWRLWVFREREARAAGTPWHGSWSGIVAKGRSLGLEQAPGEENQAFRRRVHDAAGVPLPAG